MMNRLIGWTSQLRWTILAGWVAIAIFSALALPSLSVVVSHTEQNFIPKEAESAQALMLLQRINPTSKSRTSAVIVLSRENGLTADDRAWMNRALNEISSRQEELGISGLLDAQTQPELAERFLSKDGTTTLALVYLPHSDFDEATKATLNRIKQLLAGAPEGAAVELTGSAAISQDFQKSSRLGLQRTEMITIGIVLIVLLIVFRSPVAPLVPLLTIGISLIVSRGIIAKAAGYGLTVTSFTESFLIAVLFGAGTDYCILMIQRYREELGTVGNPIDAMRRTLRGVGPAVLYSTGTVFAAFFLIGFAHFGLYKSATGVAIGLLVTLLAGMTLTPALILLLGKSLFWPMWPGSGDAAAHGRSKLWAAAARLASKRSVIVLLAAILLLTPITLLFQGKRSFDDISEIDPSLGSVVGYRQTERAFGAGEVFPLTMVVTSSESMRTPSAFAALEQASSDLARVPGVREVRSATRPLGARLSLGQSASKPGAPKAGNDQTDKGSQQALLQGLQAIALRAVTFSQGLVGIVPSIKPIIDALLPFFDEQLKASEGIANLKDLLGPSNHASRNTDSESDPLEAGMQRILQFYMSPDGRTTKIDIVMKTNPFSAETMDNVDTLSAALQGSLDLSVIPDPQVYASGVSAKYNELRDISYNDFVRTATLVLIGIAIVLTLLLRSVVGPLYLLAALVFNYLITMGLLEFLYVKILHFDGLSWTASFFIFMVVVALGVDYSIFLMSRYEEESRNGGDTREAMTKAMTTTGGVIVSAAAIMAGTFGALSFSGVDTLVQIGVGTMLGLMLYATLFMSLIVPAITFLLGKRQSWPFRRR